MLLIEFKTTGIELPKILESLVICDSLISMFTLHTSLTEILREAPNTVGVFHTHGLDFCCGGKTPLADACKQKGLDANSVFTELLNASASDSVQSMHPDLWPTSFLKTFIVENHHAFLRTALPMAIAQMTKVIGKHGERFLEAQAILELLTDLQESFDYHLAKEESDVLSSNPTSVNTDWHALILQHEREHDDVGHKIQRLRAITNNFTPPSGACATHRAAYDTMQRLYVDTMQHVFLENSILFPRLANNAPSL